MTDADFLREIEANPGDADIKYAFADFLEERGEESLATAYRVAAERGWHPTENRGALSWYDASRNSRLLPDGLYRAVCDSFGVVKDNWSLADAFRRLAAAIQKVGVPT
jgi:uncharacterized protein (TIGR02996 family)